MKVTINRQGRTTTVEVETDGYAVDERIVGRGSATCAREDHYVEKIGERLALGRALADFARQVEERWNAKIVTKAELAERKRRKAERQRNTASVGTPKAARTREVEL